MDINKLKGHVPDAVIAQIPSVMSTFKIDTALALISLDPVERLWIVPRQNGTRRSPSCSH